VNITAELASQLVREQFAQWGHLPVEPVLPGGHDNRTFRLGSHLAVRMPSHTRYEPQVEKEYRWLPYLAGHLSIPVTEPQAMGSPGAGYPLKWSVNRWLPGRPALYYTGDKSALATDLASFLQSLWSIPVNAGPLAGQHNFYRGGPLSVYDGETRQAIQVLEDPIDDGACRRIWEQALDSTWDQRPVWVHGDVAPGNLLLDQGKLCGVIDFGCMGVGDPACDLVMAWTYFQGSSRQRFMDALPVDASTWNRARGWALWKALITYEQPESQRIVGDLTKEHRRLSDSAQ